MSPATRASVLFVAAVLMAWQSVIVIAPHHHADDAVPQEVLACSASHPYSQTSHLHAAGRALSPHRCLACLAGSTAAEASKAVAVGAAAGCEFYGDATPWRLHSRLYIRLPLVRGPPLAT